MLYYGAEDYFFWQGVSAGFNGKLTDLKYHLKDKFVFQNETTYKCLKGFKFGFCLGLILTTDEYLELTTYRKDATLITNVVEDQMNGKETSPIINDEDLANTTLTGVC